MIQKYQRPKTNSGDLRIPVSFYRQSSNDGPEPGEQPLQEVFNCLAQVYGSSNKDNQILQTNGIKRGVTIKIRDPRGQYVPTNVDSAVIIDYRYKDANGSNLYWNIIDVRPDFEDDKFIVIVLGMSS